MKPKYGMITEMGRLKNNNNKKKKKTKVQINQ